MKYFVKPLFFLFLCPFICYMYFMKLLGLIIFILWEFKLTDELKKEFYDNFFESTSSNGNPYICYEETYYWRTSFHKWWDYVWNNAMLETKNAKLHYRYVSNNGDITLVREGGKSQMKLNK